MCGNCSLFQKQFYQLVIATKERVFVRGVQEGLLRRG